MSNLGQLKYAKGSMRRRKRRGAGRGSGLGGTCGRGNKGLLARTGGKVHPWFEGGQMPLQRRLPKRGFRKRNPKVYQVVNVQDLGRVVPGTLLDAAALAANGLVKDSTKPVKILGGGEVKNAYSLKVTSASRTAVEKIQAAGGSVEVTVPLREPRVAPVPEKKGAKKADGKKGKGPKDSKDAKGAKAGKQPKGEPGSEAKPRPEKAAEPKEASEPELIDKKKGPEADSGEK